MTEFTKRAILREDHLFALKYQKALRTHHDVLFRVQDGCILWQEPVSKEELCVGASLVDRQGIVVCVFTGVDLEP